MLTLIAAIGKNRELGKDNQLLWHLPDDFKHFKEKTTGHCIIMGRKTFESLPKLLLNRKHIVISRQKDFKFAGCEVVNSIEEAIFEAEKYDANPFVIGGGEIYKLAIPFANCLEITKVNQEFQADTFFPEIDTSVWKLEKSIFHSKDEKHKFDFTFETYYHK
jgi:dihydrofolate reductase